MRINEHTASKSILACLSLSLAWLYSLTQLASFNGLSEHLSTLVTPTQLGAVSSLFLIGAIISLYPTSICFDKYKIESTLKYLLLISVTIQLALCFTDNIIFISFNRFFSGIINSSIFLGVLRTIKLCLPKQIVLITGIVFSISKLSIILGGTVLVSIYNNYGWNISMLFMTTTGLLSFLIVSLFFFEPSQSLVGNTSGLTSLQKTKIILLSPRTWTYAFLTSIYYVPCYILYSLWGNMFFSKKYLISSIDASYIIGTASIGGLIGYLLAGFLDRKSSSKYLTLTIFSICISSIYLCFGLNYIFSFSSLFFLSLLSNILLGYGQTLCYSSVNEYFPLELSNIGNATVTLIVNLFGIIGTVLFSVLLGANFSANNLNIAINTLSCMFVIAIFLSIYLLLYQHNLRTGPKVLRCSEIGPYF